MPKWAAIVFIVSMVVIVAWFGNISSGGLLAEDPNDTMASLEALQTFDILELGGDWGFLNHDWVAAWSWTLDYPMFEGAYSQYIRVFLSCLLIGFFVLAGTWLANLARGN